MALGLTINFNGNCRDAVTYYADVFGLDMPELLAYGEANTSYDPNFSVSEQMKSWIMSTRLTIEGTIIEFSDMPDNFEFSRGNSIFLSLHFDDAAKAQTIFERLGRNNEICVPFTNIGQEKYYGMIADQFGLGWIITA